MQVKFRIRVATLLIAAELLLLFAIGEAVKADSDVSGAATEAEQVFRIASVYWAENRALPKVLARITNVNDSLLWERSLDQAKESRVEAQALRLDVSRNEEARGIGRPLPVDVRVQVGTTVLYRDPAKGCWHLPPPFGPRCWYAKP
jgi:hypothetical protein